MVRSCKRVFLCVLIAMSILFWGCASRNVQHLAPQQWDEKIPKSQHMKFWDFTYTCSRTDKGYEIQGVALPCLPMFPAWGTWLSEMTYTAYVCDPEGNVLAEKQSAPISGHFPPSHGIPFTFLLPASSTSTLVSVTFGYRLVLLPAPPKKTFPLSRKYKNTQVFFASQEALQR